MFLYIFIQGVVILYYFYNMELFMVQIFYVIFMNRSYLFYDDID